MRYRSDIDGLRAVAVLSVVLYHLGFAPRLVRGGFVGVDVFFVISGYLITGILQRDADQGRLSVVEFYNRRVRRIFPALFVVYLFCIVASALVLFPSEAKDVGRDVLWSLTFLSNVFYCRATGYFDQTAKTAPLLHTWSLSVEEQFYVVLPLLLLALVRVTPRVRIGILAALSLASFSAAAWMVRHEPPRAFYLMHYRAWELLLGSLLALGVLPSVRQRALAEALGAGGLGLILLGIYRIRGTTPFPGFWALLPCLGALSILHSGSEVRTVTARLLGSPPLRFVGTVSYSLYLWHWPLIALRQARLETTNDVQRVQILALAFIASVISYRYVELPFRRQPYRHDARRTLTLAALGMGAMAALAVGVPAAAARLRPSPRADAAMTYLKYYAATSTRAGTCFLTTGYDAPTVFRKDLCLSVRPDRKNFLLLGDSHAAHFWSALQALHPDINFMQATASGCSAILGALGAKRCTNLFAFVFERVSSGASPGRHPPRQSLADPQSSTTYRKPSRTFVLSPIGSSSSDPSSSTTSRSLDSSRAPSGRTTRVFRLGTESPRNARRTASSPTPSGRRELNTIPSTMPCARTESAPSGPPPMSRFSTTTGISLWREQRSCSSGWGRDCSGDGAAAPIVRCCAPFLHACRSNTSMS